MPQLFAIVLGFSLASVAFAQEFYAFQNGVNFGSPEQDAQVLKQLGYAGVSQVSSSGDKLAEQVAVYEKTGLPALGKTGPPASGNSGLKVLSVYLNVDDQPVSADAIKPLANRDALIELTIRKRTEQTVQAVRATAKTAADMNIRVALYPHHGFAVATMPQAMDLIEQVDHPNLGVMFNLCHFLRGEDPDDLEQVLTQAGDRLFAVSTCGADTHGQSWKELIQPLDQGTFPQQRLFGHLEKIGFEGPVGLQCYGIAGDKRINLERSINAWRKIVSE